MENGNWWSASESNRPNRSCKEQHLPRGRPAGNQSWLGLTVMSICYCQRAMGTSRNQKSPSESSERLPAACRNVGGLPQRSLSKRIAPRLGICPERHRLPEMLGYAQHDGHPREQRSDCQAGFAITPPDPPTAPRPASQPDPAPDRTARTSEHRRGRSTNDHAPGTTTP